MNAAALIEAIAKAFKEARFEAVMIGNAAAAINGAPVTTDDFDFMFRPTRTNIAKMKVAAKALGATVLQPSYPLSKFYRVVNEDIGLQLDFLGVVDGITSFESLRSRAEEVPFGKTTLLIAVKDVIKSKKQAGRDKDLATLPILEKTLKLKQSMGKQP